VAELGSALVAQRYGMTKHIKEDSCAYLKSWLDELKESPQFIKTTLLDVKKATSMITQRVDKIAQELEQNVGEKQENGVAAKEKIYYSSVVYLQSSDDTRQLDELRDKGDYEGLLTLAKEYYDGNGINEKYTYPSATNNKGDSLIVDDGNFAVVYNGSVGGTYEDVEIHGAGNPRPYPALRCRYCRRDDKRGCQGDGGGTVLRFGASKDSDLRDAERRRAVCRI